MKSRIGVTAIVGIALLLWGTGALADDVRGMEAVRAKNTRTNTVQLGDRSYELDEDSVIWDQKGNRISLAELDVPDLGRGGSDPKMAVFVGKYVAETHGSRFTLVSLRLQDMRR
jgi:hypothetical protein